MENFTSNDYVQAYAEYTVAKKRMDTIANNLKKQHAIKNVKDAKIAYEDENIRIEYRKVYPRVADWMKTFHKRTWFQWTQYKDDKKHWEYTQYIFINDTLKGRD